MSIKDMNLTNAAWQNRTAFASYVQRWADLTGEEHERVSRAWTRGAMERRTKHAATPPTLGHFRVVVEAIGR